MGWRETAVWIGLAGASFAACADTITPGGVDAGEATEAAVVVIDVAAPDAGVDALIADDVSSPPPGCRAPADGPLRSPPAASSAIVDVDEEAAFACVLRADGRIRCRGAGYFGVFGDGVLDTTGGVRTAEVPLDDVRAFDASFSSACAIRGDGSLWCWGDNRSGSMHPDLPRLVLRPTRVPSLADVRRVFIALSTTRACVLVDPGRVQCWGRGPASPRLPPFEARAVDLALSGVHTCARYADDRTRCAVNLLNGTEATVDLVAGSARQLGAGFTTTCAVDREGAVACLGARYPDPVPRGAVPFDDGVRCATSVGAGYGHLCASLTDGTVSCWASDNRFGQLGSPRTDAAPDRVPGVDRVVRVFRGSQSVCALRDDGGVWCWGGGWLARAADTPGVATAHLIDW